MKVLIPLFPQNDYTELKFCLRSIDRFLKPDEVIIAGTKIPDWLTGVTILAVEDRPGKKQLNIRRKIIAGLVYANSEILFLSDDVYLLKPYTVMRYFSGMLQKRGESGAALLVLKLQELGKDFYDYDVHCPIVYGQDFVEVMQPFSSYCIIKSAYCNAVEKARIEMWDCKIDRKTSEEKIKQWISGRPYFSTGPGGLKFALPVLNELFPNKSEYEL